MTQHNDCGGKVDFVSVAEQTKRQERIAKGRNYPSWVGCDKCHKVWFLYDGTEYPFSRGASNSTLQWGNQSQAQ